MRNIDRRGNCFTDASSVVNGRRRLPYWNPKSSMVENQPLAGADCAGPLVRARFLSQVDAAQQPAFLVEGFDGYEETLQPFEVFCA